MVKNAIEHPIFSLSATILERRVLIEAKRKGVCPRFETMMSKTIENDASIQDQEEIRKPVQRERSCPGVEEMLQDEVLMRDVYYKSFYHPQNLDPLLNGSEGFEMTDEDEMNWEWSSRNLPQTELLSPSSFYSPKHDFLGADYANMPAPVHNNVVIDCPEINTSRAVLMDDQDQFLLYGSYTMKYTDMLLYGLPGLPGTESYHTVPPYGLPAYPGNASSDQTATPGINNDSSKRQMIDLAADVEFGFTAKD